MAEVAAIIGFVASIGSLVDLSTKIVSRLREFTSKTSDVPESFRSLAIRLPLLTELLERIKTQALARRLPDDVVIALTAVVDSTSTQASIVQACVSDILPPEDAPRLERVLKALKSLAKEDKIRQAVDVIHKNVDFLVLHQATQHVDIGEHILEKLSKMDIASQASSKSFGVCLHQAPEVDPDAFIGRTDELQQLQDWLSPTNHPHRQCIVSIVGMGGMGKTQLSLAHVRNCADNYSSVFWVNAKDETSLRQSMADIGAVIFHGSTTSTVQNPDDEKRKTHRVQQWLSEPGNDQWLLIFDNYDNPNLPGVRSPTGYDIRSFFPTRSQGSIIITSRSTKLKFGREIRLQKIVDINKSIAILSQRSGRDISQDHDAIDLARRLDGLPLALAIAGTYLGRADISCGEYMKLYRSAWMDLVGPDMEELLEYDGRTMSSTWTISLNQVRSQNNDAAELLTFLGYLSGRDIWYELIQAGANDEIPWMHRVTENKIHFQRIMSKLQDYSLVEVVAGSYQLHPCLHDWLVESIDVAASPTLFVTAVICIAESVDNFWSPHFWTTSRRLLEHTEHLESSRFHYLWKDCALGERALKATDTIAGILRRWGRLDEAAQVYKRALIGKEKSLGHDQTSTLQTVNNLGVLYMDQEKLDEAEQMFMRALAGMEKSLGSDNTLTLQTVNNLGALYRMQGKRDEAEKMHIRALVGREKSLGRDDTLTLQTVHDLSNLYSDQGKLEEAEQMGTRALAGLEKSLGPDHTWTLNAAHNLGLIYRNRGKLYEAEQMLLRALEGLGKSLGPDHTTTLFVRRTLSSFYRDQGKLHEAEQLFAGAGKK